MRKAFNLYRIEAVAIVKGDPLDNEIKANYFVVASTEYIAERKAMRLLEEEYSDDLKGSEYLFQANTSAFVYNIYV